MTGETAGARADVRAAIEGDARLGSATSRITRSLEEVVRARHVIRCALACVSDAHLDVLESFLVGEPEALAHIAAERAARERTRGPL